MNLTKILFTVGQSIIIYFIVWGILEKIPQGSEVKENDQI